MYLLPLSNASPFFLLQSQNNGETIELLTLSRPWSGYRYLYLSILDDLCEGVWLTEHWIKGIEALVL